MNNIVRDGNIIDYANSSGSTISSGDPILIGSRIGIAEADIANGSTGAARVKNAVVTVTKKTTDTVTQGALLYWDAGNSYFTTTSSGNTQGGYAYAAAASGTTTVQLNLNA